ncbi:MAG: pyruvate kinase [Oscillospiraceae bacterium]
MKRTKIICTLGPASDNEEILRQLMVSGMDVARFNFSHGSYEEHGQRFARFDKARKDLHLPIASLLDTKGPEMRTGKLKGGKKVALVEGENYTLTTDPIEGDNKRGFINYSGLPEDVSAGDHILLDDGLIELKVESVTATEINCLILNGGELGERKGINVPGVPIRLPALTDQDKNDIVFGINQGFDFIAASFVRNADCIYEIKDILREYRSDMRVIAKIENKEGIDNIDEIIKASDAVMVARGDMGVEIPAEEVPYIQKVIIQKCNNAFKPVITATQMLDSMIRNPRPTRAEVTDVANAIYDGTDCVMLSGETAMGKYPVEALKTMVQIAESTEKHLDYEKILARRSEFRKNDTSTAVAYASVATAFHLNAKCLITPTMSGFTARIVSQFRPRTPVVATSPREEVLRRMQLYWGIRPIYSHEKLHSETIVSSSVTSAMLENIVRPGDIVVMTAGLPAVNVQMGERGETNVMRVITVKSDDAK